MKTKGTVVNGELLFDSSELNLFLSNLEGQQVEIEIKLKKGKRSLNQNAYYWGVVIPAIQSGIRDLGERLTLNETEHWLIEILSSVDSEFTHQFLKEKFINKLKVNEETGELIEVKPTTREMDKDQFRDYLERVIQFANQVLQIEIPASE